MIGLRVLDMSHGLAGSYCAKLLGDAGADVVRLEPPGGDAQRRWRWGAEVPEGEDGALFRYLRHGHRSVPESEADRWRDGAHVLLVGGPAAVPDAATVAAWRAVDPSLVVVCASTFGLDGPWAGRPGTEFIAEAESGGLSIRGGPERPPIQAGVAWSTG